MRKISSCLLCGWLALQCAAYVAASQAEALPLPRPQWLGAASCSAAACHGGDVRAGAWKSAHTTWITRDPHARAFQTLFNEDSERIMRTLGRKDATSDQQCLSCHVHPGFGSQAHHERFTLSDGVGCESCHGPAEHWLSRHSGAAWQKTPAQEKARLGWRDTQSLLGRARVCVDCHVGGPGSEVNHDLIAAGHPVLRFEFNAHHGALPAHWSPSRDRARHPDLEIRGWQIGQVVSAQAALSVLQERAGRAADPRHPWPEFAEYDCTSCHQKLGPRLRAQAEGGRKPGALRWSTWYAPRSTLVGLEDLSELMERPLPDRRKVIAQVKLVQSRLTSWPEKFAAAPRSEPPDLFRDYTALVRRPAATHWDEATQRVLALRAHQQAWRQLGFATADDSLRETLLEELRRSLNYPPSRDGPRFDRDAVAKTLRKLAELP